MSKYTKLARDIENLSVEMRKLIEDNKNYQGINASNIVEPVPVFNRAEGEIVYANQNNSWIVLGRDRPATEISGFGGEGATQCAMLDLVTGRMSSVEGGPKSDIFVSPNFKSDAARIYISQRTNIDKNFDLVEGGVGMSKSKSGIGIKADAVRIIGREGIKLVTNHGGKNSQGGKIKSTPGIDLIAGNDDARHKVKGSLFGKDVNFLQPLVKGDNLIAALVEVTKEIGDLATRFDQFAKAQMRYNTSLSLHTHLCAAPGTPSALGVGLTPSHIITNIQQFTNTMATSWSQSKNLSAWRLNYLMDFGDRWICSRYNRTT